MAEKTEATELLVRCDCGYEARGAEDKLIPAVQKHGREAHNMWKISDSLRRSGYSASIALLPHCELWGRNHKGANNPIEHDQSC